MKQPLRVLMVEDMEDDAQLILHELRRSGCQPLYERVETGPAMADALEQGEWDLVLSDYALPEFNALAALSVLKRSKLDIPMIVVSGTIGEDVAVEVMRAGAFDYLMKGNLKRLVPAIERELREAGNRAERRRAELALLLSDRMASVGTLAAGVAHEINNPLSYVIANLDFALGGNAPGIGQGAEVLESLRQARDGAERVRLIVRDLKTFSRADSGPSGAVDIHRVLDSSASIVGNEIRHRARLVKDYGPVAQVRGNEPRLGQVFLNLLVNAAQAIDEGKVSQNEIRISTHSVDDRLIVEVTDTGSGIPLEVIDHVFEPFVTTKPIGVGTGLGLSICQNIVTTMGGKISVKSELGKGTTFRVELPIADEVATVEVVETPVEVTGGSARILVVDDEPMILNALRRTLEPEHRVSLHTSGREALELINQGQRFDIILCDLMMPEMTGIELHEQLNATIAEQAQRMVFLTGGAFTNAAREFLDKVPNRRVEKPFDTRQLRALIRDLLLASPGDGTSA
jgi:signal transduction histidine kinase